MSRATVSRVVNHPASVRPETRRRVERAIGDLRYRPSRRARELSLGVNTSIAIVTARPAASLALALTQQLSQTGLEVTLTETSPQALPQTVSDLLDRMGGLVIDCDIDRGTLEWLRASDVPVVGIGRGPFDVPRVVVDAARAFEAAARHLRAGGHDRALLLDAGSNHNASMMRSAFGKGGVKLTRRLLQTELLAQWLVRRRAPSAVVATDPVVAFKVCTTARALGVLVPHDLAVVSVGSVATTRAMGMSAVHLPIDLAAQSVADLMSTGVATRRQTGPAIEIEVRARFVPGVTTRRAA